MTRRLPGQTTNAAAREAEAEDAALVMDDPASAACGEAEAGTLHAAMLDLPEEQRLALTLAYFGGYTQSQIAEQTGVPLGTVKTRMYLAMRRVAGGGPGRCGT